MTSKALFVFAAAFSGTMAAREPQQSAEELAKAAASGHDDQRHAGP